MLRYFISYSEHVAIPAAIADVLVSTSSTANPLALTHGDYSIVYAAAQILTHDAASDPHLTIAAGSASALYISYLDTTLTYIDNLFIGSDFYDVAGKMTTGTGPIILAPQIEAPFFMSAAHGFPNRSAFFTLDASWVVHNDEAVAHGVDIYVRALITEQAGRIGDPV